MDAWCTVSFVNANRFRNYGWCLFWISTNICFILHWFRKLAVILRLTKPRNCAEVDENVTLKKCIRAASNFIALIPPCQFVKCWQIFLELNLLGCPPSHPARAPEWSITQSSFSYGTELSFRKTILNLYLRSWQFKFFQLGYFDRPVQR